MKKNLKRLGMSILSIALLLCGVVNNVKAVDNYKNAVKEGTLFHVENENSKDYVEEISDLLTAGIGKFTIVNDWLTVTKVQSDIYHIEDCTFYDPICGTSYLTDMDGKPVLDDNGEQKSALNNPASMYIVLDGEEAMMIDAGNGTMSAKQWEFFDGMEQIVKTLVGDRKLQVILTHLHGDHIGTVNAKDPQVSYAVVPEGTKVYIHENDFEGLSQNVKNNYEVIAFGEDDLVGTENFKMSVVTVPPHTSGCNALINYDREVIFSGDALGSTMVFIGGTAQNLLDYEAGLYDLIEAMKDMKNPIIYCGHRCQQTTLDAHPNSAFSADADDTVPALGEVGKYYVKEIYEILQLLRADYADDDKTNDVVRVVIHGFSGNAMYSPEADLNNDGIYPGIGIRRTTGIEEFVNTEPLRSAEEDDKVDNPSGSDTENETPTDTPNDKTEVTNPESNRPVKTGDNSLMSLYGILAITSGVAFAYIKKRKSIN